MKDYLTPHLLSLAIFVGMSLFSVEDATAQTHSTGVTYVEISSDFNLNSIELAADDASSKIVFWSRDRGNVSLPLAARVWGPDGTQVRAFGAQLKGTPQQTLETRDKWYPIKLGKAVNGRGSALLTIRANRTFSSARVQSTTRTSAQSLDVCSFLDDAAIQIYIQFFSSEQGGSWDKKRVCEYLNELANEDSDSEDGVPDNSPNTDSGEAIDNESPVDSGDDFFQNPSSYYAEGVGYFQKDNCAQRVNAYLAIIEVDISRVNRSQYPNGIPLRAQLRLQKFNGRTASSLKPAGDEIGKYAGRPLILMSSVYSADEKVSVTSWKKGKPNASVNISVNSRDRASWRGFSLVRAPIDFSKNSKKRSRRRGRKTKSLGRKGTFDLMSPYTGYGVCFKIQRVRQRKNGYPS
jgi:hypothetical protein